MDRRRQDPDKYSQVCITLIAEIWRTHSCITLCAQDGDLNAEDVPVKSKTFSKQEKSFSQELFQAVSS